MCMAYQCQFIVIEEERKFKVMRKLLGPSGANMRAIVDRIGAKLRLRADAGWHGPPFKE